TECQLGFSANARNLEYIIRKLKYSPIAEARRLSGLLYNRAKAVVPSLIILSDPRAFKKQFGWEVSDGFLNNGREKLEKISARLVKKDGKSAAGPQVKLIDYTKEADAAVIAALMYSSGRASYSGCLKAAKKSAKGRRAFMKKFFKNFTAFDSMPRGFEAADFTFEVIISAGAFAQLKRHRMMSLFKQPYDISLGTRMPPSIEKTGLKKLFTGVMRASERAYSKIKGAKGRATAEYALTNAHKRRLIVKSNLREVYHIARLRMDSHAQWDIRDVSADMVRKVKDSAPLTAALACGKDTFNDVYNSFMR
ncbi:MAG TPA: FAD-dependent thymidylate synthase, partial [Spirochaetota bacterium]|nr:FAD-dependent thymidylate synthase [Spirochaetota bacterium]